MCALMSCFVRTDVLFRLRFLPHHSDIGSASYACSCVRCICMHNLPRGRMHRARTRTMIPSMCGIDRDGHYSTS